MNPVAILIALAAVMVAVFFFLSARTTRQTAATREKEAEALRAEVEATRKEVASLRSEVKERREEVTTLRGDLRDAKKKAFDQAEAAKKFGGATALRGEIDKLSARLAEARAEATHGGERVKALESQLEKAAQELEKARAALVQRQAQPAPAPAPMRETPPPTAPAVDAQKLAAERDRADKAETRLTEARKRISELEKDVKNVRGRLETEKRVYMVQKGELDLAADRYAELRRRHDALRKDHDELLEAVRQAAREDRRLSEEEKRAKALAASGEGKSESAV